MKICNKIVLVIAAAAACVSGSAQTCNSPACAGLTDNAAVLSSPRYREVHPELLLAASSGQETPALTDNAAVANSPRYREDHPQLLLAVFSAEQPQAGRPAKLTDNKALAASPRYREDHPELLHLQNVFEVAPVK